MLTLTEAQYQRFMARDTQHFTAAVADQYLADRPDMQASPGRAEVIARMQAAYDNGVRLGFTSTPHIVYMMYMSADAPQVFEDEVIQRYLGKAGATPEQRLDDLDAVLKNKLDRMNNGNRSGLSNP